MQRSLFAVDSRVIDVDQLLVGVEELAQILRISPEDDAVAKIAETLAAGDFDHLEILSHGQPGGVLLGRDRLDGEKLTQSRDALKSWGRSLGKAGEIILHGCQVGAGEIGRAFVAQLHRLTGAGVAANREITGGDATKRSWDFGVLAGGEVVGRSRLSRKARSAYPHTLIDVTTAFDDGTGTIPGSLSEAIAQANATSGPDTIVLKTDVTVTGVMKSLINSDITITGDDPSTTGVVETRTISGSNSHRPLFIKSGNVTLQDLTVTNGLAQGGNGGSGGAGAGLGGALFIYGGTVDIRRVDFTSNRAIGGSINNGTPRAGGGMYGSSVGGPAGGGGLFANGDYGRGGYDGSGAYGGFAGLENYSGLGGDGGFGGGGGYGSGFGLPLVYGGDGGFGAGGGEAYGGGLGALAFGGDGGFGGGGGYSYGYDNGYGGFGGYGGGGGAAGAGFLSFGGLGGFGGGNGQDGGGVGGAGAGFGGAVFVRSGTVNLESVTFSGNQASPGNAFPSSGPAQEAEGRGGAIFIVNRTSAEYALAFGNAAGVPSVLPTVNVLDVTFSGSFASNAAGVTGLDGVGANQDNSDVYGTIAPGESPVLANLAAQVTFTDNRLALMPQVLDSDVSVTDVDSPEFEQGSVTVSYAVGGSAEDQLSVQNVGTGTGQISVEGSTVSFEGTAIATIDTGDNGTNGTNLVLTLNSAATPVAVEALIESLTYGNADPANATPSRTLAIAVSDGRTTSAAQQIEVLVDSGMPDISVFSGGLTFDGETTPFALDSVAFGETFERSLRVRNRGNDTLNFGGVVVPEGFRLRRTDGEEIVTGPFDDSLEVGQILDLVLERTNLQVNSFAGELSFISNDPDQPNFVIPLTGQITFAAQAPLAIDFTLTRLSLPPIEADENSVRLDPEVTFVLPQAGDVDETTVGNGESNVLLGFGGNDNLIGLGGNDLLKGASGDDQLEGGDGDDRLFGGSGSDRILGGAGNDIARGEAGDDVIDGGSGSDFLLGDGGNDFIDGADGSDLMRGGDGADSLGGGLDNDLLFGGDGADLLAGEDGNDSLLGGDGNDQLDGGFGDDILNGQLGDDVLFGNDGNDSLLGGDGADLLAGGSGLDTLTGGLGADTFAVDIDALASTTNEFDVIIDFEDGADLIAIAGLSSVDTLIWRDGANGVEVLVNNNQIFQLNGISSSAISPADFVT